MFKSLFTEQRDLINYFFSSLNTESCQSLVNRILSSKGVLFLTGIGKSGFITQKIAATLMSTGTKAFYLPPLDALHGDLGMISKEDFILIFSKSGETEELLELVAPLRSKEASIIAITSDSHSRLANACDTTIFLPCLKELCPFDLAPTISSEIQLIFGDALAISLMKAKNFSLQEFAQNHPAGKIGKRANLKVKDIMLDKSKTPFCSKAELLENILVDFTQKRCGCMIVTDEKRQLKGIFTDGDLRRALQNKKEGILKEKIGNLMTPAPKTIDADSLAWEALRIMESDEEHPIMVLPVISKTSQEVIGIVKMHDLIQAGL